MKRTSVSEFENINRNGKIAISLKPDDELRFVKLTTGQDEVIISGSNGKRSVRFNEDQVRIMGRSASGVLGFNCDGSEVVGALHYQVKETQFLLFLKMDMVSVVSSKIIV